MRIGVLGPLVAHDDRGADLRLGGPKQRAVLAMLALAPGRVLPMDSLVDGLWEDDPPARAVGTIQVYVHGLRKALGDAGAIRSQPPGYLLAPEVATDLAEAGALRRTTREREDRGDLTGAADSAAELAALWRGEPLADLADFAFARNAGVELREQRLGDVETMLRLELELGRHREALPRLEGLVAEHPSREGLWRLLVLALYRDERQADALAAFRRVREVLADELGVDPGPGLRELEMAILRQDPALDAPTPTVAPLPVTAAPLPRPPQPMVGRDALLEDLLARLAQAQRVVTLTGPGGIGKTRTALEVAHATTDLSSVFVDLASAADAAELWRQVGAATGLRPDDVTPDAVAAALSNRPTLLVLDNLEQVDDGAAAVAELVAAAPSGDLRVLVTSRAPLRIAAEHVVPVGALDLDDAVDLFAVRARAASPTFDPGAVREDLVALCERLDRLPLALEIAAARVRLMGPADLLADLGRLGSGAGDLPERQRTLAATVAWSLDLLPEHVRDACRRLAVFADGFSAAAATAVVDDDPARALESLSTLIDSSLVAPVEEPGEARFRLYSVVADVVDPQLDPGQRERLGAAHAAWYADHLHAAVARLDGPEHERTIRALVRDDANLQLAWRSAGEPVRARLVSSLTAYWISSGRARLGLELLADTDARTTAARAMLAYHVTDWGSAITLARRALPELDEPELATRVRCHLAAALLVTDGVDEGRAEADRAAEEAARLDVYDVRVLSLSARAIGAAMAGDFALERACYDERLALARRHGDRARTVDTLATLAEIGVDDGDWGAAREYAAEAAALAADWMPGEQRDLLIVLARIALEEGEVASARRHLAAALDLTLDLGDALGLAQVLRVTAAAALAEHQTVTGARLAGAARELVADWGELAGGPDLDLEGREADVRTGGSMHPDDVVALARAVLAT